MPWNPVTRECEILYQAEARHLCSTVQSKKLRLPMKPSGQPSMSTAESNLESQGLDISQMHAIAE